MIDRQIVQNGFDAVLQATLSAAPAVAFLYDNQEDVSLSTGTAPYVRMRVNFSFDDQVHLGNQGYRRQEGSILLFIHVRTNTGPLARNQIVDRLTRAFRSTYIAPATTFDAQVLPSTRTENWEITAVRIPFYFDNPRG